MTVRVHFTSPTNIPNTESFHGVKEEMFDAKAQATYLHTREDKTIIIPHRNVLFLVIEK